MKPTQTERKPPEPQFGAFVISLDFELHWGVRDNTPAFGPYHANLMGARVAIPRMLDLFAEFDVAATWATVGFLFANSRREMEEYSPLIRPRYENPRLDPYQESVGEDESADPLHFAPSLIEQIRNCPRQEIATHTYSHFYCREKGVTAEMFRADLTSAIRMAAHRGISIRSIVLPRNQFNPEHASVLRECGILAYRGNERSWMYRDSDSRAARRPSARAARLLDAYVSVTGSNNTRWSDIAQDNGLYNVPSSRRLRHYTPQADALEGLRLRRITSALRDAAETRRIFHLCWHPHNFGLNIEENLNFLRRVFESFARLRADLGMRSLSMWEVAATMGAAEVSEEVQLR